MISIPENAWAALSGGALFIVLVLISRIRRRKLNTRYFKVKWQKLQRLCSNKMLWYKAVVQADNLLDEALKIKHYKGKTTGERLVAAQHVLSSNDSAWFGHKLKNKIIETKFRKLTKTDTLKALAGFRQALKDLGALEDGNGNKEASR